MQPVLWLMLFGKAMSQVRGVAPGNVRYLDFLAAGILAQSALFVAIFYGISAIWERDLGVLQRYPVRPAPRSALVLGKALSAGVRALSQALIVCARAPARRRHKPQPAQHPRRRRGDPARLGAVFDAVAADRLNRQDVRALHGIGQVLTMPIFFASNAVYPLSLKSGWLRALSHANPLTYEVDALRALMLTAGASEYGLTADFTVLAAAVAVLIAVAARMYGRRGF